MRGFGHQNTVALLLISLGLLQHDALIARRTPRFADFVEYFFLILHSCAKYNCPKLLLWAIILRWDSVTNILLSVKRRISRP